MTHQHTDARNHFP